MAIILDSDLVISREKGSFDLERWVVSRPHDQFEIAHFVFESASLPIDDGAATKTADPVVP
jgi:hypothetical protein